MRSAGISFVVERETAHHQLRPLSARQGHGVAVATRRLALEAAFILERVRIGSLVKWFCADNVAGLRTAEAVATTRGAGARNRSAGVLFGRGASCTR